MNSKELEAYHPDQRDEETEEEEEEEEPPTPPKRVAPTPDSMFIFNASNP